MTARFTRRNLLQSATAVAAAAAAGALIAPGPANAGYGTVASYSTTVNGDAADVYHPVTSSAHDPWAVVLLLQGANVDKSQYSQFATKVAGYGFVVVVPNHYQVLFGQPGLYVTGLQAAWTVAWAGAENVAVGSPLAGRLDTSSLLLLGHSFGGAAGLSLSTGLITPPFAPFPTPAPAQLKAAAFFGANNAVPGSPVIPPVANIIPVALVQGSVDSVALPANGQGTYDVLAGKPKLYVSLAGANHYGITNSQNPAGARPDLAAQTLAQTASIETAARWSGLWLRAQLGDPVGKAWVYGIGDAVDANVTTQFVK